MPISRSTAQSSPSRPKSRIKQQQPSSSRTSSSPQTKRSKQPTPQHWSTDEEQSDSSIEQVVKRTRKKRPTSRSIFRNLFFSFLTSFIYPLIPYFLFFFLLYIIIAYSRYLLYSYLSLVPSFLQPSLSHLANLSIPLPSLSLSLSPLTSLSCSLLGVSCPPNLKLVSTAARTASLRAKHALTVFDHLIALGSEEDSVGLSLHPVEIWELSTAIRYSSGIEEKEFISDELASLGDSVREVKDLVIGLNAQGMNAFTWIVHEFTRLEELISRAATSPVRSSKQEADLSRLLDSLFDKINLSLNELLTSLDRAVPTASLASDKSRRIFGTLRAEESEKERELSEKSWIEWISQEVKGTKGRQLRKDLELTRGSAEAVVGVWQALEGTRESLVGYRNNVGFFKAGVVGYHLSSNDLSVEDEVNSLKSVMEEMKATLSEARGRTRRRSDKGGEGVREIGST